ncbi:MAG: Rieske 2Fe-2S domain-containing protein [Chloroflexi bacterium]|nr:Rieske 2Fe-2S domain-containing protein [Chloroflexota bacterium]
MRTHYTASEACRWNFAVTVLFTISFFWRWADNWQIDTGKMLLSVFAYFFLCVGGYLGGTLVFRYGTMVNRDAFVSGPKGFVSVLAMQDLPENKPIRVNAKGVPILLVRRGEEVFAVSAVCSHFGGPLEQGKLIDGRVQCPWHYSQFVLEDGRVIGGPATSPLPIYETRIDGGQIQVKLWKAS